jgi:hypothetical protein
MYSPIASQVEIMDFTGGLNVTKPPTDISDNQSPDCQNIINNELIGINSRYGYTRYYSTAIGSLYINGLFVYNTFDSSDFIMAYGTSLLLDLTSSTSLLYSGMVSGVIRSFEMGGKIYFLDGSGYIQYDGSVTTQVSGRIPTYYINKNPDGASGTQLDELNYIQSAFTETFNGDGTATTFYMTFGALTTGNNTVIVNNATLTSGGATAGFNVNYSSGYFTLTTAATTGVGNVEITTHKQVLESTAISNCTFCETYGEGNDTFAFLSGNSSYPARIWWSDTSDPSYFPATSYADVGVTNDKMMGFQKNNGALQLWKYRSVHSFNGTPPDNSITEMYVNNEGLIATDTLKLIDGYPTCLSQRGVIQLSYGNEGYYFKLISEDINGRIGIRDGLLTESNKNSAFAYDFDNKYWLYVNNKIYIYQYDLTNVRSGKTVYPWEKWLLYNTPRCFVDKDNYLYFGNAGNLYKLDPDSVSDDGTAIDSHWYSKKFEINGQHDWVKWFLYIYFNYRIRYGNANVSTTVFIDDVDTIVDADTIITSFWNPNEFNPNAFNPNPGLNNIEKRLSLYKKGKYIQFKVQCNTLNSTFTLLSAKIDYMPDRKVV